MSLLERARNAAQETGVEQRKRPGSAARAEKLTPVDAFSAVRDRVQELVAALDIVGLSRTNMAQAKSEVRQACRQAFAEGLATGLGEPEREQLCEAVLDSMFGLGPLEAMLADNSITEIMVNGPQSVFYEREGKIYRSDLRFVDDNHLRTLIDRILSPLGRRIDESSPMVDARLPQGHRVNAVIPPISPDGPVLTIRKFASQVLDLDDLEAKGTFPQAVKTLLAWAVRARKDIAVSGGTGAGKTTLLNALSCCIPQEERIVTIEDSAELRFLSHPDVVRLEARQANAEGTGRVTIRNLLVNALRMRPDRIVVGECRGEEALDMLQAMNTGHEGSLTTLHANSPAEVVSRLSTMVRYAADIPLEVIEAYIARAFDVVVQMSRDIDGHRKVTQIAEMAYDEKARRVALTTLYTDGVWQGVPSWIDEVVAKDIATAEEVEEWKAKL